jgi:hypothetical protein
VKPQIISSAIRKGRKQELTWRYVFNFYPALWYRWRRLPLAGEAQQVLNSLRQDGIATSSIVKLLDQPAEFSALESAVQQLEKARSEQLRAARPVAEDAVAGEKSFNVELLGENPLLELDNAFARFALQSRLLEVANAYFGMFTRLRYYNVWHTFATTEEARQSQLWHRDREDFKILKVFVYLSDVDEGAGPLTYAKGTQLSGVSKVAPEYFVEGGVKRSTDDQMATVAPPETWSKAIGPKGTIVFADTSGYHKGGLARTHDRLMYVCMFTSPASQSKELFRRSVNFAKPADKALAFALSPSVAAS